MNTHFGSIRQIGSFFAVAIQIMALSMTGCKKPVASEAAKTSSASNTPLVATPQVPEAKPPPPTSTPPVVGTTNSPIKVLVFRNVRSWNRKIDFEDVLTDLGISFDVKTSVEMESADLSPYGFVIIPGAQFQDDFYLDYAGNAARFDGYVTNGGTIVLELNGAERDGIILPRGVSMVKHGATDNSIAITNHPILLPLAGRPIHANYASHGYLGNLPKDATILVTESVGDEPAVDKPTFIEYTCGAGRVIAACQCFHDRDGSGRGPLMQTVISYAAERQWFNPLKQ
jgi:hypothetical protein